MEPLREKARNLRERHYALCAAAFALWPLLSAYVAEMVSSGERFFFAHVQVPSFLLGLLAVYLLAGVLLFLTRSFYAANLIVSALAIVLAAIDRMKYLLRAEHLFPWDIYYIDVTGELVGFIEGVRLPAVIYAAAAFLVVTALLFPLRVQLRMRLRSRAAAACVCTLCCGLLFTPAARPVHSLFGIGEGAATMQNENYNQNGFLGAMVVNLSYDKLKQPRDFNQTVAAISSAVTETDAEDNRLRPDVIVILSETFWDPCKLQNIQLSADPLTNYRAILEKHAGGEMVSPTFGGGTARAEFEVLGGVTSAIIPDGAPPYAYLHGDATDTFASYFRTLGYETVGIHTNDASFYDRDRAYPRMGFDAFYGIDQMRTEMEVRGDQISDDCFVSELIYELEEERDTPLFLMGISMENHGMYGDKYSNRQRVIRAEESVLTKEEHLALENYASGAYYADQALGRLYDYVQSRERPTVVLFYGDHLPALFAGNTTFAKCGLIGNLYEVNWSEQEQLLMHSTPYVLFDNFDGCAGYALQGQAAAGFHLIPQLIAQYGLPRTPLVDSLLEIAGQTPAYSPALANVPADAPEQEQAALAAVDDRLRSMAYAVVTGKQSGLLTGLPATEEIGNRELE